MANDTKKNITETDIKAIQASLIIPLFMAVIFATIDIIASTVSSLASFDNNYEVILLVSRTLIAYIFAAITTMVWQSAVISVWSGIKEGMIGLSLCLLFIYLIFYIIYMLLIKTCIAICFLIINFLVVIIFTRFFLDTDILHYQSDSKKTTEIHTNIVNSVSGINK